MAEVGLWASGFLGFGVCLNPKPKLFSGLGFQASGLRLCHIDHRCQDPSLVGFKVHTVLEIFGRGGSGCCVGNAGASACNI